MTREETYAEKLRNIPQLADLGPPFHSSPAVDLTESETEYLVKCVKHVYERHLVFQFICTNTLNDQLLENVRVQLDPLPEGFEIKSEIPCQKLPYGEAQSCFSVLEFPEVLATSVGTFGAVLKFSIKDCDPATGLPDSDDSYDDEYMLEDLDVSIADQMQKVAKANFAASWDEAGDENELEDVFALTSMQTLDEAVKNIIQFLGMQPCERSDRVPEGKSSHTLLLSGVFRGNHDVLVRAKLALSEGVTMQLAVRCSDPEVSELVTNSVG